VNDRDLVFHGLAVKRHAAPPAIASLMGIHAARVQSVLAEAVAGGRAIEAKGGYALTPLARLALEGRYSFHFESLRENVRFVAAYESFERINRTLKQIITDWQAVEVAGERVVNDHTDAAHDEAVMDRLAAVHEQVDTVLQALAGPLPRMRIYQQKLLGALESAEDGDREWVSDVRRESYHTVWFELHEDLLRIMGRAREE
jgi:hypothetical protein